jgi:peptide/nickel transport system substrate-binding protein
MRRPLVSRTTVIAVAACAMLVSGCGQSSSKDSRGAEESPTRGGEITILRQNDIDSWDPGNGMVVETFQTLPGVMEGLVRPGHGDEPIAPGLATSWKLDAANKTLTFQLRPDLKFSDGSPLTAEDAAFSAEQWPQGMMMGSLYSAIESAEATDDTTLVLHLKRPSTFLLSWLANGTAAVVPKDFQGKPAAEFFKRPIGAGPFKIADYRPGQQLVLERNEHYYDPKRPYLDKVIYDTVADPNQVLLRLQSGEADIAEAVPLDLTSQLPEEQQVRISPSATSYMGQTTF